MPSFLELLESSGAHRPDADTDAPTAASIPLDVLASVKAEGTRRRIRRHRRNVGVGGLVLALVAVPAFGALGGGGDDRTEEVTVADADAVRDAEGDAPEPGTTATTNGTGTPQSTAVPAAGAEPGAEPAPASETTPTTASRPRPTVAPTTAPTTAPALVCEQSTDPACGGFYWSPAPGSNAALSLDGATALTLAPGEATTIVASWSDADASLAYDRISTTGTLIGRACRQGQMHGPWTPPAPAGGSGQVQYGYTAPAEPGTYTVTIEAGTSSVGDGSDCAGDPYLSDATLIITVTVTEPVVPAG